MINVLVTGANGQAGSILCELLLCKGYKVFGLVRRSSVMDNLTNLGSCLNSPRFKLLQGDISDYAYLHKLFSDYGFDYVYNAAAQSHVGYSFKVPKLTAETNYIGVMNLLEVIKNVSPATKMLQFSTSEMYGNTIKSKDKIITLEDKFLPESPYAISKVAAHDLVVNYRKSYNLHVMCGVFFNMESERRSLDFVTRKATNSAAAIKHGTLTQVGFGNIESERDWGSCWEYMEGAIKALEYKEPREFLFASGKKFSVTQMLEHVFNYAGLGDYRQYVYIDEKLYRPSDVGCLLGDSSETQEVLSWKPSCEFKDLIEYMYDYDYKKYQEGK